MKPPFQENGKTQPLTKQGNLQMFFLKKRKRKNKEKKLQNPLLPMKSTATTKLYRAHLKFGLDKTLSDLIIKLDILFRNSAVSTHTTYLKAWQSTDN